MPRYTPDVIAAARRMYCADGRSFTEIAGALGISKATVTKWAKSGGWDKVRGVIAGSIATVHDQAAEILQAKLQQLRDLPAEQVSAPMLDGLTKLFKIVNESRETLNLFECVVLAGEEFVNFVRREVPDEATRSRVFEVWEKFLDEVKTKEG